MCPVCAAEEVCALHPLWLKTTEEIWDEITRRVSVKSC
jgi:hypothetical protein